MQTPPRLFTSPVRLSRGHLGGPNSGQVGDAWSDAWDECLKKPGFSEEWEARALDKMTKNLMDKYDCGYGTRTDGTNSGACTSNENKRKAQAALGVNVDGDWGKNSQAALDASGKTFQQLVPGCASPVPHWTASGGSGVAPGQESGGGGSKSSSMIWAGLALGVLAVGIVIYK